MSYNILKSDTSLLTAIPDGAIDQTTDLTLVGKNTSGYGIFLNDNFVYLLENFANTSAPNKPITGQLWFDLTENRLKVYDTNGSWKVSGGTITSSSAPTLTAGDLWIDNIREQLYFNDGLATMLAGPIYSAQQGVSGFIVEDIIDINNLPHTIVSLYVAQTLIGVFNKDSAFTPATPIAGIPGIINTGFTGTTLSGLIFDVLTSKSKSLVANDGTLKTVQDFVSTTANSLVQGTISIANPIPLKLGSSGNIEFDINPSDGFVIKSVIANQNFQLQLKDGLNSTTAALFVNANTRNIGLYNALPQSMLHVGTQSNPGSVIIEGNLTVNGTTTSTNTATVNLADYTITLAKTSAPNDVTANGAGLIIAGTTNKSILYNSASTSLSSSENINIASGKTYKINGESVLSSSALGVSVHQALGLSDIGSLNQLQAAYINITGNVISYVNQPAASGNIVLTPKGAGTVDVSNYRITSVANPSGLGDAVNLAHFNQYTQLLPLCLSLNTFGLSNTQIAQNYLNKVFLPTEHGQGAILRLITQGDDGSIRQFRLNNGAWVFDFNI